MIFALGFLSATLLALLALPVVTRRVQRLTRRRLEASLPVSLEQVAADRDQLRAAFAVEHRRVERKAEEAFALRHQDQLESGRRALRIQELTEHLGVHADRVQALEKEIADLQRNLTERIRMAEGERDQRAADMARNAADLADLRAERDSLADNRVTESQASETQVSALKAELAAMQGALSMAQAERDRLDTELQTRAAGMSEASPGAEPQAAALQAPDLQALRREIDGLADRILAMGAQASAAKPEAAETSNAGSRKRRPRRQTKETPRTAAAK